MASYYRACLVLAYGLSLTNAASNPCCEALSTSVLNDKLVTPGNYTAFRKITSSYWSNQEINVNPSCFVQPANGGDVSVAIQILTQPQFKDEPACKFAIRSGGHTAWPGAANINGGVTIDLSNMKEVVVSDDKTYVSLGPGNRWGEVYPKLEAQGVAVSGGRWGNVGVGGLLTGGGLSFYQGVEGLACDGVINHEVVLANGSIVNANDQENTDLHKALKGGSNNFGIVTRFYLKAFPRQDIWGGMIMAGRSIASSLAWFQNFANSSDPNWDPRGMTMFALGSFLGQTAGGSLATYSKPQNGAPAVFQPFWKDSLSATTKQTTISAIAAQNAALTAAGGRTLWATITHVNSAAYMQELMDLATEKGKDMPTLASGIQLIFQPLWQTSRAKAFASTGGNVLGLEDSSEDLVIVLAMTTWVFDDDDAQVRTVMQEFIDLAQARAKRVNVYNRYIYTNYAADFQDPMAGYGEKSLAFMREVSKKYDPGQVFQKQVPGGFKLERSVAAKKPKKEDEDLLSLWDSLTKDSKAKETDTKKKDEDDFVTNI